jgi:hypothetical protein
LRGSNGGIWSESGWRWQKTRRKKGNFSGQGEPAQLAQHRDSHKIPPVLVFDLWSAIAAVHESRGAAARSPQAQRWEACEAAELCVGLSFTYLCRTIGHLRSGLGKAGRPARLA